MAVRVTVRFPDELYDRIKTAAQHDQRSIHGQVLWLLSQALDSKGGPR